MAKDSKKSAPKTLLARRQDFPALLHDIQSRIRHSQMRAVLSVNAELVRLYWDIGNIIASRQRNEGWGLG